MTKVLIVDDRQESLRLLETALTKHGYSVVSARNGAEALAQARTDMPDLVVSDLLMPVMDGYTLLRHWKKDPAFAHIPFVIYTATFTDADDQHFGEGLGADAYIMKPARMAELMNTLQGVLANAAASAPSRPTAPAPPGADDVTLKYYSERLIRKLEEKTLQLERVNQALQREIGEHQRASEEILFNNAILKTQQEASLDGILVVSTDGKVLSYNQRFLQLWNIEAELLEECRDTPLAESPRIIAEIGRKLEDPAGYLGKVRHLHKHREETSRAEMRTRQGAIYEVYSAPAIGADRRHYGRIWYYRDVTEARRVQIALEASVQEQLVLTRMLEIEHARLVAAQHIANVGSWEIDLANTTVTWSDVMYRIFECDPATFRPTPAAFLGLVHPDDRAELQQVFVAALAGIEDNRMQHRLLLPDRRVKIVEQNWRIFTDEQGEPARVLGTCLDITDYKLLLDSLHEKAVQLSNAQRIGRMGSWSSDVRSGRLTWADSTCELFGIHPDEFRGTFEHFRSFIVPEDLPAFDKAYQQVSVENPMLQIEYRIRRPDGEVRWIFARGNVEFDANGAPLSRAGMVMDITEQRVVREQLARSDALLRMAGRLSKMGGWSIDTRTGSVFWSEETCVLHEVPVGHAPSMDEVFAFYPAESRELFARAFASCRDDGAPFDLELQVNTARGNTLWVRITGEALGSDADHTRLVQGAIQDISAQKAAQEEIHGLGNRLIETFESITDAFFTLDTDWNFTYINGRAERLLQRERTDLLGRNIWEEFADLKGTVLERNYRKVAAERQSLVFEEYYARLKSWFEINVNPSHTGLAVYFHDITRRKETEAQLAYLHRVRAVLSGINALIVRVNDRAELFREACRIACASGQFSMAMLCIVDPRTRTIEAVASEGKDETLMSLVRAALSSPSAAATTMVSRAIATARPIVCNDLTADAKALYRGQYLDRGVRSMALLPLNVRDRPIGVLVLYAKELDFFQDDEMSLLTEMADDIAFAVDHIEKKERLDYLANFDTLTGLANRTLFLERLRQQMNLASQNDSKLCIALLDLARFKNINDTLGRGSGDALLQLVAEWLIRNTGKADQVARVGADQFVVVFVIKPQGDLNKLFESLTRTLEEYHFKVNDTTLRIAARSGIATYPGDGADADALLRNAEAALKEAKASNARFKFYTRSMNVQVGNRLAMENLLRQALGNNEFVLYYQPKASLLTGRITGAEALIRWNDPHGRLVLPGEFIPILEDTGMIADVGQWAMRTALSDYLRWRRNGLSPVRVAVNVSPLQLNSHDFIADLQREAELEPIGAAGLEIEITESVIMDDIEGNTTRLKALRALGITVAIDDFGTGFSSLGYLAKLPVDTLKIDRSFVVDMTSGPQGLALVSTIIGLAHALNLKVIAEGVDNEEQKRLLRLLKCDEMQGFVLSPALPVADFENMFLRGDHRLPP